jgi:hypothetical protein
MTFLQKNMTFYFGAEFTACHWEGNGNSSICFTASFLRKMNFVGKKLVVVEFYLRTSTSTWLTLLNAVLTFVIHITNLVTKLGVTFLTFISLKYTQINANQVTKNSIAMYEVLKTSHPGEIRTHDLLIRWRRRWPLHQGCQIFLGA